MADNTVLNAGAGGDTIATDDIAGVKYQIAKLAHGALDAATLVSTASGLPVDLVTTIAVPVTDNGGSLTVDGTVAVSGAVDTELTTADLDTGAGTDTRAVVGLVGSKSGGGALIPGDATAGLKVDLGADNDVTVTGTVTANLAAGVNNIGDVDVLTIAAGDNNIGNVDIVTVPAPLSTTGSGTEAAALRVTVATDSTGVLSVDDNGGSLTVDNGGTFAVQDAAAEASLSVIDDWDNAASDGASVSGDTAHDAVDAGEPVKIGGYAKAAAPTAVSLDGDRVNAWFLLNGAQATVLTAAGALIGGDAANGLDIDVTRIAAGDNNIGNVDIVSVPAPLSTTGSGTEATALRVTVATDSTGVLSVDDNGGALTVDNGGTFAVQDAAAEASLSVLDDWDNAASDGASVSGDTAHDAVDAGEPVKIGGYASAAAPTGVSADADRVNAWFLRNGAQATVVTAAGALVGGDAANGLDVDVTRVTGTVTVQDTAAEASLSVLDDWDNAASDGASVSGDVAHDSADAGEPVKVGFKAYSPDGTTPGTAVAENDRTNAKADLDGIQYVNPWNPQNFSYHDDDVAAVTTDGTVKAAPGAGFAVFITDIIFSIGAATASSIFLEESTTKILGPYYLEAIAGRGMALHFHTPKRCTANTAILVTNTGSITFSVDILGFVAAV